MLNDDIFDIVEIFDKQMHNLLPFPKSWESLRIISPSPQEVFFFVFILRFLIRHYDSQQVVWPGPAAFVIN